MTVFAPAFFALCATPLIPSSSPRGFRGVVLPCAVPAEIPTHQGLASTDRGGSASARPDTLQGSRGLRVHFPHIGPSNLRNREIPFGMCRASLIDESAASRARTSSEQFAGGAGRSANAEAEPLYPQSGGSFAVSLSRYSAACAIACRVFRSSFSSCDSVSASHSALGEPRKPRSIICRDCVLMRSR